MRVRAEGYSDHSTPLTRFTPFVVGRLVEAHDGGSWSKGDRVLVSAPDSRVEEVEAAACACVRVPDGLASADALLIPPTAQALRVWRRLRLEIGEAAVLTDGDGLADFIGLVAMWHGGLPVIRLTSRQTAGDVEIVNISDAPLALERLRSLTAHAPGLAAVDLSGSGEILAMLLEALPRWGRLMLAGPCPEPFTTAFYTDIHRKGVVVCSDGDLDSMFSDPSEWNVDVRNACRLLMEPKRAAKLRACLPERPLTVASSVGPSRESNVSQRS